MRVVIDTNVLISAIFWIGKPKQLLNLVRHNRVTLVTSDCLLEELKEILTRSDKPFCLSADEAQKVLEAIQSYAEIVEIRSQISICDDEMDNQVIACAIDGRAQYVISGDGHLLNLGSVKGIKIMSVSDFLSDFEESA